MSGVSPGSLTIGATSPFQSENVQDCTTLQTYPPCPTHTIAAGSPGTVAPTVTISGPTNIAMLKAGAQGGGNSITLSATGNPGGGTFSWTAVSGQSNITILNATSQSAIVQSVAVGTYTVQVTYTVNGKQGTAITVGSVQQPGQLGVISNNIVGFSCFESAGAYTTQER